MLHILYYDYVHRIEDKTTQTNHMLFHYFVYCYLWTMLLQGCVGDFPGYNALQRSL